VFFLYLRSRISNPPPSPVAPTGGALGPRVVSGGAAGGRRPLAGPQPRGGSAPCVRTGPGFQKRPLVRVAHEPSDQSSLSTTRQHRLRRSVDGNDVISVISSFLNPNASPIRIFLRWNISTGVSNYPLAVPPPPLPPCLRYRFNRAHATHRPFSSIATTPRFGLPSSD